MIKLPNMRYIKHLMVLSFLMLLSVTSKAQQVPLFNQYFQNQFLAYPSTASFTQRPSLSLIYRGQFSGLEGSPETFALSFSNSLGERMGIGANISGYRIGFIRQNRVQLGYSYALLKGADHSISAGLSTGLSFFSINEDIVSPETFNDPVLSNLIGNNGTALNVDFSLSYRYKNTLGFDIAAPTVINQSLSDDEFIQINEDNVPDYIAGAFYKFSLDPIGGVYLTPNVTWRYREVIGSEFDVLLKFDFKEKFQATGGYRDNYGPTIGAGVFINPRILVTYNYDFGKADVPFLSDGFNEIGLHFNFKSNAERMQNRYTEGEAVLNRIRNENIYDRSLISDPDQKLVVDYLSSLESSGSKSEKRQRADERFDEILDEMRRAEQARLQAQVTNEKEKQDSIRNAEAEAARKRAEEEAEAARIAAEEKARAEAEEQNKNEEVKPKEEVESPLEKAPTPAGSANELDTNMDYLIVVASYAIDSRYARLYLNDLKSEFPQAGIFRSVKRSFDYVYVESYNDYDKALNRMRELRNDTRFGRSWVHIVRLSR